MSFMLYLVGILLTAPIWFTVGAGSRWGASCGVLAALGSLITLWLCAKVPVIGLILYLILFGFSVYWFLFSK